MFGKVIRCYKETMAGCPFSYNRSPAHNSGVLGSNRLSDANKPIPCLRARSYLKAQTPNHGTSITIRNILNTGRKKPIDRFERPGIDQYRWQQQHIDLCHVYTIGGLALAFGSTIKCGQHHSPHEGCQLSLQEGSSIDSWISFTPFSSPIETLKLHMHMTTCLREYLMIVPVSITFERELVSSSRLHRVIL